MSEKVGSNKTQREGTLKLTRSMSLKISHSDLAIELSWVAWAGILFESAVFATNQMLVSHVLNLKEELYWPFINIFHLHSKNTTKPST